MITWMLSAVLWEFLNTMWACLLRSHELCQAHVIWLSEGKLKLVDTYYTKAADLQRPFHSSTITSCTWDFYSKYWKQLLWKPHVWEHYGPLSVFANLKQNVCYTLSTGQSYLAFQEAAESDSCCCTTTGHTIFTAHFQSK